MIWEPRRRSVGTVAVNLRPRKGPWGGAAQWASQLVPYFKQAGWSVRHDLKRPVDVVLFTHTGLIHAATFSWEDVAAFRKQNPHVPVIQRINDNDLRKGTKEMDALLSRANEVADFTVFVSSWLRDYHAQRWFDTHRPHAVIEPGADPSIFHPIGNRPPLPGEAWRVVTHHWSPHWSKGFDIYQQLDKAIAEGALSGFELWVIGRWPEELRWHAARTFPPASGHRLAALLRQCHLYVTASRHEPGAMHPVEGIQCGLPVLFHRETGGTATLCADYGLMMKENPAASLLELRERYKEFRKKILVAPPSGPRMCEHYRALVQRLAAEARGW